MTVPASRLDRSVAVLLKGSGAGARFAVCTRTGFRRSSAGRELPTDLGDSEIGLSTGRFPRALALGGGISNPSDPDTLRIALSSA